MGDHRVVVVDDKQRVADLFENWLSDMYDVATAYSGTEALQTVDERTDLVLIDRRLPDLSGDEVIRRLRSEGFPGFCVVVSVLDSDSASRLPDLDAYLSKPISRDTLLGTVTDLLGADSTDESFQDRSTTTLAESVPSEDDSQFQAVAPARVKEAVKSVDMEAVAAQPLPDVVTSLAAEYEAKIGQRDVFLLKWLHSLAPNFTLPSVDDQHFEPARTNKILASMFVMLLDDIGERHHDLKTLSEAAKLPVAHETMNRDAPGVDRAYLDVAESVWETLKSRLAEAPRYDEIEGLLEYDFQQVSHAIRYSTVLNEHPEIANLEEATAIEAHNMMMLTYADIDLAASSDFDMNELSELRELILRLQRMARIGNWITTWERELHEGDFSSGVVIYALENDIVSTADLTAAPTDTDLRDKVIRAIRAADVEETFLDRWEAQYREVCENPPAIESLDVERLVGGMKRVMAYHLASRGLK